MKKIICIVFGVLLASPVMAEKISQTIDADDDGYILIFNTAGSVEVSGWSQDTVEITGTLGDDVEELVFERDGNEIEIKVKSPSSSSGWGRVDITSDLVIKIPQNSSLEVATVSADIDVTGVHGEQEIQSISGEVTIEVFGEDIQVESISGDVEVTGDGSDAEVEVESVSGDVEARRISGDVSAGSVSGDVTVREGSFDRAQLETVNGDIYLGATLRDGGRVDIETVNGDVEVQFGGDVSARFDIETFNGDIDNCFGPKAQRSDRYTPGLELSFSEGSGEGRVSIATLNGGVEVCN